MRLAEAGIDAVATDYFGRTAGNGDRGDDFDCLHHVRHTRRETIASDAAATIAALHTRPGVRPVFTVGFCFRWHQLLAPPCRQ